jgi:hypothetical protein
MVFLQMVFLKICRRHSKKEDNKCFICYSHNGKTEKEILFEMFFNTKLINYPLLSMNNAYGCECRNYYAHNKCLVNVNKCPTCRKSARPNLYIITKYDLYCGFLLQWLKKDINRIDKLNSACICYLLCIYVFIYICSKYNQFADMIIPSNTYVSLLVASTLGGTAAILIYILTSFNDYLGKYWLYDIKHNKCWALID